MTSTFVRNTTGSITVGVLSSSMDHAWSLDRFAASRSADEYSVGEKLSYAFTVLGAFILSVPFTVILSALLLPAILCIGLVWLFVDLARAEQSRCHTDYDTLLLYMTGRVFLLVTVKL